MKKFSLALVAVAAFGLAACSSVHYGKKDENTYRAQIIMSEMDGTNLKLVVRKNDCSYKPEGQVETIVHPYNSTLVVGACVQISNDNQGMRNISTVSPRNPF